jgi:hypothetical protein
MNSTGIGWIAKSGETKPASASATGKTQLCIVFAKDYDNQQPGTFDYTQLRFSEYSGTANDPKLVVTYSSSLTSTIVDTINLTENTSRLLSMISSKVETITLSESFSAMRAFVSSVTETINLSEFTSRIQSFVSLNIDTISLSESFTTIKSLLSTVVDTVNLSELNQSFKAHVSHVLDSITMVDLVGSARTVIQKTKILSATIIKPTMV